MQKIAPFIFLGFGAYYVYEFVHTFVKEIPGPFRVLFWDTDINGFRMKCIAFAVVCFFAFYTGLKRANTK